jgi:hypothetical protein
MAEWAGHNVLLHRARAAEHQAARLHADHERKAKERERFLRELTRRHMERLGLSATVARQHIDAVSVTARKRDEAIAEL